MSTEQLVPDQIQQAPPTAKLVYFALQDHSPMTYDELTKGLHASRRAVENGIAELRAADYVDGRPDETEPCRKRWMLTEGT